MATSSRSFRKGVEGKDAGVETGSQDIFASPIIRSSVELQAS